MRRELKIGLTGKPQSGRLKRFKGLLCTAEECRADLSRRAVQRQSLDPDRRLDAAVTAD